MTMQELHEAIDIINSHGGDFEGQKEKSLVQRAELVLGLKFPPTYLKFLEVMGCGDIFGVEIYGIVDDNFQESAVPNGIWLTLNERRSGLAENLVIVSACGAGGYYAIDTAEIDSIGESPIVLLETNGALAKKYNDFGSFLLAQLAPMIDTET